VVAVGGVASNGSSLTVVPAPSITSLNPTSGAVGTSVTVAGRARLGTWTTGERTGKQMPQSFRGQLVRFNKFAGTMMCNSGGSTWLGIGDWNRNHGHALRQGFKHSIQSSMRDAQRCTLQQFNLWSRADHESIRRSRTQTVWIEILTDRKYNLNIFPGAPPL
jgi:hypothetical protein